MIANELRIGNYFSCDAGIKIVNGVDKFGFIYFEKREPSVRDSRRHQSQCEGIPLSPEILEKAGFVLNFGLFWEFPDAEYLFMTESGEVWIGRVEEVGNKVITYISHIHQLQNLYWCLCGKELEINL